MPLLTSILFPKKKPELAVLFDIGSGSVGGALTFFQEGKKPYIVYTAREQITIATKVKPERLIAHKKNALNAVTERITRVGLPKARRVNPSRADVKNIFCVFSAPWHVSKSLVTNIKSEKPTVVTLELLDKLIGDQAEQFEKNVSLEHEPAEVIEKRIIDVTLNGYHVNYMYHKSASELSFTLFLSALPKRVLKELRSLLGRFFHSKNLAVHSFTLSNFAVIRDMFGAIPNFLFLDVTGEATEVSLVKKGVLLKTASFPLGRNFVIRKTAESFSVTPNIARSLLSLYAGEKAERDFRDKMRRVLDGAKKDWALIFRATILAVSEGLILPETIFLTVDRDVEQIFSDWISNEHIEQFGATKSSFKVFQLDDKNLRHFCNWGRGTVYDPFLIIESIFMNKLLRVRS